jgi:hypothetical protein
MGSHSDGVVSTVEGHELGLEHDVAVDLQIGCNGLETAKASWKHR